MINTFKNKFALINSSKYGCFFDFLIIVLIALPIRCAGDIIAYLTHETYVLKLWAYYPFFFIFPLFYLLIMRRQPLSLFGTKFSIIKTIQWLFISLIIVLFFYLIIEYIFNWNLYLKNISNISLSWTSRNIYYAFFQEIYYRGFAYDVFDRRSKWSIGKGALNINYAVIGSSMVFMIDHVALFSPTNLVVLISQFLLGFIMGIQRERTGNILSSTIFHTIINFFGVSIIIPVTQNVTFSLFSFLGF